MKLSDFKVGLVESLHIHRLIVNFDKVSLIIVLSQLAKQGSKLYPIVTALDVLQKNVPDILFKDVKGKDKWEEILNFFFEEYPKVMLSA